MKKILLFISLCVLFLLGTISVSADYSYADGVMTFYGEESIRYSFRPAVPEGEKVHTLKVEEGVKYLTFGNTFDGSIKTLILPSTLESINDNLFNCLLALEEIQMPKGGKFHAKDGVLFCGKELWYYPVNKQGTTYKVPADTQKIHKYAFAHAQYLESVTVYGDVEEYAFNESKIKTADIYSENIDKYAFYYTPLESLTFHDGLLSIGKYAFSGCNKLTELTIPASVTTLGEKTFSNCGSLKKVTVLGSPFLPESCFIACSGMETFHIEGTHWTLSPFSGTFKLKDLYIGKLTGPITNLPPYSERIFYGGSEEEWNSLVNASRTVDVYFDKKGIEKVVVEPVTLKEGYEGGYLNKDKTVAWYTDENYIVHIYGHGKAEHNGYKPWSSTGENGSSSFKGLIVHEGVTELGPDLCSQFRYDEISLPTTLNKIGDGCFTMTFCDRITIRSNCLDAMSFLNAKPEQIILTKDVTYIPTSAFQAVISVDRITLPKGLTYLGSTNFSYASPVAGVMSTNLKEIHYPGTKEEFDKIENLLKYENSYKKYEIFYNTLPFSDVYPEMWHHDYVRSLYESGIVNGVTEELFEPDGLLTWGQAMKILVLSCGEQEQAPTGEHWASGYLSRAQKLGWLTTLQDPDAPISRLEFCQVAAKAQNLTELPEENPFTDTADSSVLALVKVGVISGTSATTFDPNGTLTRGQIAKIATLLNKVYCDHSHVTTIVEPTQRYDGYTLHTCSECGHFYKDNYTHRLRDIADFTPVITMPNGFRTDGWKGADYGSGEKIIGSSLIAGQFVDHDDYTRRFYTDGVTRDKAESDINNYASNVYGGYFKEGKGLVDNERSPGSIAKIVEGPDGRPGVTVFQWRKSTDSNSGTNSWLNMVMEAFCYFTKDKNVAYALWSWIDAENVNGSASSADFGFKDVSTSDSGGVITMNGINITVDNSVPGQTTYYFN